MRQLSVQGIAAVVASLGLSLATSASVAADKYAVVSAIGDELTIVTYQPSVGTNLDSNQRQVVPLADDSFDAVAVKAAEAAIHKAVPGAVTVAAAMPDRSTFTHDELGSTPSELTPDQLDRFRKGVTDADTRYLLIISKSRGETRLEFRNDHTGEGKLFGIGYYFDRFTRVTQTKTGREGKGFLSPYAYLTITLVDLQTGAVVRTRTTAETTSIAAASSLTETHPWDAVPAETKVRALSAVIRRAILTNVPSMVAPT